MQPTTKKLGNSSSEFKEPAVQKHFILRNQPAKSVGHGSTVSSWQSRDSLQSSQHSPQKLVFPETIYIPNGSNRQEIKPSPFPAAPPSASGTGGFSTPLPLEEIGEEFEEEDVYKSRAGRIGLNGSMQDTSRREPTQLRTIDIDAIPTIGTQGSDGNEMIELKKYIPSYQQDIDSRNDLDLELNKSILQTRGFDTSENNIIDNMDLEPSFSRSRRSSQFREEVFHQSIQKFKVEKIKKADKYSRDDQDIAVQYELSKYPAYYVEEDSEDLTQGRVWEPSLDFHVPPPSLLLSYNTPKREGKLPQPIESTRSKKYPSFVPANASESRRAKHQSFEVEETILAVPSKSEEPKGYRRLPPPILMTKVTSGTGSRNDRPVDLPKAVNIHYSNQKQRDRDEDSTSSVGLRTRRSQATSQPRDQRSFEIGLSSRKRERELSEFLLGNKGIYR